MNCRFAAADIRVTPGVSTGVNTNPPPPELRPVAAELVFCQRYYNVIPFAVNGGQTYAGQQLSAGSYTYPTMRAVPTVNINGTALGGAMNGYPVIGAGGPTTSEFSLETTGFSALSTNGSAYGTVTLSGAEL